LLSKRFQLRGLIGVDLVIAKNRAWVLEINPRYSSSAEIVERVCGESLIAAHVAACGGELPPTPRKPGAAGMPSHGKIVLYAKRPCTISDRFFEWAMAQSSITTEHCRLADIPAEGQELSPGQPVLTLFASAAAKDIDVELGKRIVEVETRLYDSQQ
jgi:predicted ATP-grasp superfamily ATP-dependent carboligase